MGAFGGRKDIMAQLSPLGGVYQAGTLSGNPMAVAAGLATLRTIINTPNFYSDLQQTNHHLQNQVREIAHHHQVPFLSQSVGGMFGWFFTSAESVHNEAQAGACDFDHFKQCFQFMLQHGIYLAPSPFEAGFISAAHQHTHIQRTVDVFAQAMERINSNITA